MSVHAGVTLPAATLIAVADAIPYPTVALAALNAAVTREILSTLPRNADPAERASRLSACGVALYQLGRPAHAVAAEQEAVTLTELGRPADALPVTQEADTIRRELAAASPDRSRPDLARSLSDLGVTLTNLGRPADALPVTQEAVAIRRELAAASPDRYRPASPVPWAAWLRSWRRSGELLRQSRSGRRLPPSDRSLKEGRPGAAGAAGRSPSTDRTPRQPSTRVR